MSETIYCLQCGESQGAIRQSQRNKDPIYCGSVDCFGESIWDAPRHRFRDWKDYELDAMWVLPEFFHLYRRVSNIYSIASGHQRPIEPEPLELFRG